MIPRIITLLLGIPVILVVLHTIVRVVRTFYKFPMPEFMASAIDNPLRRKIQPPAETARRHGIESGMRVLDVGPGNGTYTLAAAERVGAGGKVVAIDIEPKMVERVRRRAEEAGVDNIEAQVADVYKLPFDDGEFDVVTMIAVIGEIPEPERAMQELRRILAPGGLLSISEILADPDYTLARTLLRWAEGAGFRFKRRMGNFFCYTVQFGPGRDAAHSLGADR